MGKRIKEASSKATFQTSGGERLGYGLYNFGQNFIYSFVNSYLMTFLLLRGLDTGLIAVVLLVVKIWDAINDALFGGVVDKVRFKNGGKFMPWIRISLVFIPLATILLFSMPATLSQGAKVVWLAVAYILWDAAYTVCDVPNFGLATTMTTNQQERTSIMTVGRMVGTLGAVAVILSVPALVGEQVGLSFMSTSIIVGVVAILTMLPLAIRGVERVKTPPEEESITIRQMMRYLFSNKYLLIRSLSILVFNGLNTATTLYLLVAYYLFDNTLFATIMGLMMVLPVFLIGFFVPKIVQKVDKARFYFWCTVVYAALSFVIFFAGYSNLYLHLGFIVLRGLVSVFMIMQFMFTPDCAEYGQYKTGIDAKGIAFATQTFTAKLCSAMNSVLGVLLLGFFGWQAVEADSFADLAAMGITQTSQALNGLWFTYALVPAIGAALTVFILLAYKLNDKDVQLMARYNTGEITREECDAQLSRKY